MFIFFRIEVFTDHNLFFLCCPLTEFEYIASYMIGFFFTLSYAHIQSFEIFLTIFHFHYHAFAGPLLFTDAPYFFIHCIYSLTCVIIPNLYMCLCFIRGEYFLWEGIHKTKISKVHYIQLTHFFYWLNKRK